MDVMTEFSSVESPAAREAVTSEETRSRWTCDFVINGRFLTQPVTGVQRYAREITGALDVLLHRSNGKGRMISPRNAAARYEYQAISVDCVGFTRGHCWEQVDLPLWADRPILSLCNVGPALARAQVVCIHDANVFREAESYSFAFRALYKTLLPLIAKGAARIATVSNASRRDIARYLPIKEENIVVIPNGHEHALRWNASRSSLASTLKQERPFIFLLGSRALHKNTGVVIQLAEKLNDRGVDLVIAGGAASIYSQSSRTPDGRLRWLGRVSDDDLAFLYDHALCLAFPSRSEGFGLPLVEAMARGCPVVTSNVGSMPEVCGLAALLASPDEPAAWLEHFTALAASQGLRSELRERGFHQVKRYSWEHSARAYLQLYGHAA
jgi:glycosyltransferase involved in cell wall biosynthesis